MYTCHSASLQHLPSSLSVSTCQMMKAPAISLMEEYENLVVVIAWESGVAGVGVMVFRPPLKKLLCFQLG